MRRLAVALMLALALTGCSSGDDTSGETDEPAADASVESEPAAEPESAVTGYECEAVWVVGGTLPEDYDGTCTDSSGSMAVSGLVDCVDGSQYSTWDDRFFAALGGAVAAGPNGENGQADPALTDAYDTFARACLG